MHSLVSDLQKRFDSLVRDPDVREILDFFRVWWLTDISRLPTCPRTFVLDFRFFL
jgi:hypothetical protein